MAFEPSTRSRQKGAAAAARLLDPGTTPREYVVGHAHARLTTGAIVAISVFSFVFLVALAMGYIIIPGGLLLIFVYQSVRPPRAIVVADQGLAVLNRSWFNGRPSKVVTLVGHPAFPVSSAVRTGNKVTFPLGDERIACSGKEYERLLAAATATAPSTYGPVPAPPPPSI